MKTPSVAAILLAIFMRSAMAAPFCLGGIGMPPQCIYDDVQVCRRAVNAPDLTCVINPDAIFTYFGSSRYCAVGSDLVAQCLYVDRNECNNARASGASICFDRAIVTDPSNPFRFDPRLQY